METNDVPNAEDARTAGLRSNVQAPERGAAKLYRALSALRRVSAAVSRLRDLDAILHIALDSALAIMNETVGGILLLDEQAQTLSYRVSRGLSHEYVEAMRLRLGEGIAGTVAQTGNAVLLEDISTDPRAASPDIINVEGLRAFVSVPLRAKDVVLGVLNVASRKPRDFTVEDMQLVHAIADQLGVAIEQAELYDRLTKGRERYQRLARNILVSQEEERRRVARELHDETGQTLAGLALSLQALVETAERSEAIDDAFKAQLRKAQSLAVQTGTEVTRITRELRPYLLDSLGLVPAIRRYAEDILRPVGIEVRVETRGAERPLASEVEAGLFRVAQGNIGNIMRHSRAKNAAIALDYQANQVVMSIKDDGKGFDVSKLTGVDERGRGSGLFSMKERVKLMGGSCSVESRPGSGTTVAVTVPLRWRMTRAED
jgi:signal transduction histidine kinase